MRAIVVERPGGPDRLQLREWPEPVIDRHEVLVEVRAAALNHADVWVRQGHVGRLPIVPGIDASGVIAELGSEVDGLAVGDRVMLDPVAACGRCDQCAQGEFGSCPDRASLGQQLDGSYAEFVKCPAANAHRIVDALSFEEAAAVPTAFFTAWQALQIRARIRTGEVVVIMAAGGGVGSAGVQVAALAGARVVATAGNERKLTMARELGAHHTIDYGTEDLGDRLLELTDGRGADVIFDTIGASMWEGYLRGVRRGGRIVTCGFTGGNAVEVDLRDINSRRLSIMGTGPQGRRDGVSAVVDLVNRGRLRGVVDRVLPLSEARAGHEAMEDRSVCGNVILRP